MTDLSYTAWDDNQYPWPPPDGWYQASDGKWWPEGYGPPVAGGSDAVETDASVHAAAAADTAAVNTAILDTTDADTTTVDTTDAVAESGEAAEEVADVDSLLDSSVDTAGDTTDDAIGDATPATSSDYSSDYSSPSDFAASTSSDSSEHTSDSAFASSASASSASSAYPSDSSDTLSDFAASAQSATSDYTRSEAPSGLAGWAQSGSSSVADLSDRAGSTVDSVAESSDTTVESALSRLDDLQRRVESQEFGFGAAAGAAAGGLGAAARSVSSDTFSGAGDTVSEAVSETVSDRFDSAASAADIDDAVSSTLASGSDVTAAMADVAEVDDLVSPSVGAEFGSLNEMGDPYVDSFSESASEPVTDAIPAVVVDSPEPVADLADSSVDFEAEAPAADPNPYYGGSDTGYGGQNGYQRSSDYGQQGNGYPTVQGMHADQQLPSQTDYDYGESHGQIGYGTDVLTPVSTPTPKGGGGRRLLYVVLGLLALIAAGFAGYVLFQLQDDGSTDTGAARDDR